MMQPITHIEVGIDFGEGVIPVGKLALGEGGVYFQYDGDFIGTGLEISPRHLGLARDMFHPDPQCPFESHLPGVFYDSLPDIWGRRLLDRYVRANGIDPDTLTPLDRLAHIGTGGMGALVYQPDRGIHAENKGLTLDLLAEQAEKILRGEASDILKELAGGGSTPGGARPKTLIAVNAGKDNIIHSVRDMPQDYTAWMVKFPDMVDGYDAGAVEYIYARMARDAGVEVSDFHLFDARTGCAGYFATRLFDRGEGKRYHMHSICGILHARFEVPSLDYGDFMNLAWSLTRDIQEVEKLYRIAVFNVLAHNRDDHSKNFGFLMGSDGRWRSAPGYDLTYARGPEGHHKTWVMGEGRNPGKRHLMALGEMAKLDASLINEIIERTIESLSQWRRLAREYGVGADRAAGIARDIDGVQGNDS